MSEKKKTYTPKEILDLYKPNYCLVVAAILVYVIVSLGLFFLIRGSVNPGSDLAEQLTEEFFPKYSASNKKNFSIVIKPPAEVQPPRPAPSSYPHIDPVHINHSSLVPYINPIKWDEVKRSSDFWVVKYHKYQNCLECNAFKPDFDVLAYSFMNYSYIKFGEIDCEGHEDICDDQGIQFLPEIWLYRRQIRTRFVRPLNVNSLQNWIADEVRSRGLTKPIPSYVAPSPPLNITLRSAAVAVVPDGVVDFNSTVFSRAVKKSSRTFWVVKFFRPSCPHCKNFQPAYEHLTETLKDTKHLRFGNVDCEAQTDLCRYNMISAVPTLRIFFMGSYLDYFGSRDVESLTKWITESMADDGKKITSPHVPKSDYITVLNEETFNATTQDLESPLFWFIKFTRKNCQHCKRMTPIFVNLADSLTNSTNVRFGEIDCNTAEQVCISGKLQGVPTLRLYYKNHTLEYPSKAPHNVTSLTSWLANSTANGGQKVLTAAPPFVPKIRPPPPPGKGPQPPFPFPWPRPDPIDRTPPPSQPAPPFSPDFVKEKIENAQKKKDV